MAGGSADIIIVYFIGTIGMVLLAGAIFFFFVTYQKRLLKKELELNQVKAAQQEEILKNTVNAQEKERRRIARDLHDEVGAMLSVVKLNLGRIEKLSGTSKQEELTSETKSYLNDTITQVRRISRALLPPSLEKLGLFFALEEFANWVNKTDEIKIDLHLTGEQFRFDNKQELAVFRVIQEILNNAIKHSNASNIQLISRFSNSFLSVVVSDNGKGFMLDEKIQSGLGLKNLKSRTEILGAKFKLKSSPGNGTTAVICLHVQK